MMQKPNSIVQFERSFLAANALNLISYFADRANLEAQMASTPGTESLPAWFLLFVTILSAVIGVLLWFFVAKRRSAVARNVVAIFFGVGLLAVPSMLSDAPSSASTGFIVVTWILNAIAVWALFRAGSKPWFRTSATDQ